MRVLNENAWDPFFFFFVCAWVKRRKGREGAQDVRLQRCLTGIGMPQTHADRTVTKFGPIILVVNQGIPNGFQQNYIGLSPNWLLSCEEIFLIFHTTKISFLFCFWNITRRVICKFTDFLFAFFFFKWILMNLIFVFYIIINTYIVNNEHPSKTLSDWLNHNGIRQNSIGKQ